MKNQQTPTNYEKLHVLVTAYNYLDNDARKAALYMIQEIVSKAE